MFPSKCFGTMVWATWVPASPLILEVFVLWCLFAIPRNIQQNDKQECPPTGPVFWGFYYVEYLQKRDDSGASCLIHYVWPCIFGKRMYTLLPEYLQVAREWKVFAHNDICRPPGFTHPIQTPAVDAIFQPTCIADPSITTRIMFANFCKQTPSATASWSCNMWNDICRCLGFHIYPKTPSFDIVRMWNDICRQPS